MSIYLETIKTKPDGKSTAEVASYPDEMTAAIYFHYALNINLREVQNGNLKAYYANTHTDSGVILQQERWAAPEPAPEPEVTP